NNRPLGRGRAYYQLAGYLMVGTAALLFGFNGNLSRFLFQDNISPVTLVEFRMLIGALCLLAVLLLNRRKALHIARRDWPWVIAFGLSLALVTYAYFMAIKYLPIAIALVIQFSAGAWMALGEALWRRKPPSWNVLVALALTLGGIVLLTGLWHLSLNGLDAIGLIFAVLALLTYIAYLQLGQRLRNVPSLTAMTYGSFVASLFWLCIQPPWAIPASTWTPWHMFLITLVGILGMAIPFTLDLIALQYINATRAGIAATLELAAASIIAYFWLGQRLDLSQIIGCLGMVAGIMILPSEKSAAPEVA
ncbi:MAG: EamA family transporter, partial [Ktedonobacteraceae bacterium]|nr:EamA family transporter [Ktedonobacteraceae bacterium]